MAMSANIGSKFAVKFGYIQKYTAGAAIYRGATVVLRLAAEDDKVYPASNDTADTNKELVVGFALEAAGSADVSIRVRQDGKLKRNFPSMPSSVIGRLACVLDDDSVQLYGAGTCKTVVGRITEVATTTEVFIDIADRPLRIATSLTD